MSEPDPTVLHDRDLSWLAFNGRVLQEARDPSVPLLDRLTFLGIVSSNLDEFFRVRVAGLRAAMRLKKKQRARLGLAPRRLHREILRRVRAQQEELGAALRGEVLPGLADAGICLVDEVSVSAAHRPALQARFERELAPLLRPVPLEDDTPLFLEDRRLYLAVGHVAAEGAAAHRYEPSWSLVAVPTDRLDRFVALPASEPQARHEVIFLDDVIRMHLPALFPGRRILGAHAVKLSRDAELAADEEVGDDLAERIRRALAKRRTGTPSRFLFDGEAPYALVEALRERLDLVPEDLVPGWRYHHLADLTSFPDFGRADLRAEPMPPLPHPGLPSGAAIFAAIRATDHLLQLPYQAFDSVVAFLDAAAADPDVRTLSISLYRVARESAVARALIRAAERGVRVTAFVEVQARFDEATNLEWADRMRAAGVRVLTSREGIKVHAKIALVTRAEAGGDRAYAYLGTGNFNERTARSYSDLGLFTAHPELTGDVAAVLAQLEDPVASATFTHLLVAPTTLRQQFEALVRFEMAEAEAGRPAAIALKLNALEDAGMVGLLREAAEAGVTVTLVVRGICCLVPDAAGRITIRSIVDRYLEHARIYRFHHGGARPVYVGSADWMTRNLDRRVEVVFPVLDPELASEVSALLDLQLADTVRARVIDAEQANRRVSAAAGAIRAQVEQYRRVGGRVGAG